MRKHVFFTKTDKQELAKLTKKLFNNDSLKVFIEEEATPEFDRYDELIEKELFVYRQDHMSIQQRLDFAGIKTIRTKEVNQGTGKLKVLLEFDGKQVIRPNVNSIEDFCEKHFSLVI